MCLSNTYVPSPTKIAAYPEGDSREARDAASAIARSPISKARHTPGSWRQHGVKVGDPLTVALLPARRVPGLAECVARRAGRGRVSPPLYLSLRDARGIVVLHVRPTPRNSYTMGTPSFARCSRSPTPDSWRRCGKPTAPAGRITSRTAVAPLDLPAARESEADGARALERHSLHERVGDEFEVRALRHRPQIGARGVGAAPAAGGLLAPADAVGMAARKGAALSRSPGVLITDGTGWRADAPGGASERYRLPAGLRVRIAPENKRRARHDAGVGADERHVGAPPVCTDLSTLRSWVNPA